MTINASALFRATKMLWPETVRVSADPDAINRIYQKHVSAFSQDDDWRQLALWSFHQALNVHEKRSHAKGLSDVHPRDVTFTEFDNWMRLNLNGDECWVAERMEYEKARTNADD